MAWYEYFGDPCSGGLILLICVPTIQIVYSLQSKYISDIVQNEPISISQNIATLIFKAFSTNLSWRWSIQTYSKRVE